LDLFDVEAVERAEAELDNFINKRACEREKANEQEEFWADQERQHRERRREENRVAWYSYERHLERVHMGLAAEHRARAEQLEVAV
jgi:hypothetical protein